MSEFTLTPKPPLAGYARSFGETHLAAVVDLAIVSLALPLRGESTAERAIKKTFGAALPKPGLSVVSSNGTRLVRLSSDQALALFTHATPDAEKFVQARLDGAAYTTDQTDAWVGLSLNGPGAVAALERICQLDLHDSAFAVDHAARTVMEHLGVLLIRTGAQDWLLLSASSSAKSFLHAVETSLANTH